MKKLITGLSLGIVIGASALLGAVQIPSVRSALSRVNIIPSVESADKLEDQQKLSNLEAENLVLKSELSSKTSELESTKSELNTKENLIVEKNNKIQELNTEIENLNSEIARYKELAGSDVNYLDLISTLDSQLKAKTTELDTANAELEQLRADKETLTNRVTELEAQVEALEAELTGYKTLGEVDHLKVSNYNGTWYKNGEFSDYYVISDGIVTHNNNEDNGVINPVNNEMLMFLSASSQTITLAQDGMSFINSTGDIYKKFYINTIKEVTPSLGRIAGTYNLDSITIELKADNTLVYTDEDGTYYGAYLVKSEERNIGGNIKVNNTITATINKDDEKISKTLKYTDFETYLTDENNIGWEKIKIFEGVVLSGSPTEQFDPTTLINNYVIMTVKFPEFITVNPGEKTMITVGHNLTCNGVKGSCEYFYNLSDSVIYSNIFTFYIEKNNFQSQAIYLPYIKNRGNLYSSSYDTELLQFIEVGTVIKDVNYYPYCTEVLNYRIEKLGNNQLSTINCSPIEDYITGTYSDEKNNLSVAISDISNGTITLEDGDPITATSVTTTATTDGYDIYHTIEIKYSASDTSHTLVINLKNDKLVSSTLDSEDYTLIKN